MQNMEDVDELVELPPAPDHVLSGAGEAAPVATGGAAAAAAAAAACGGAAPSAQVRAAHERALRRIGVVYAPLQHCHAFRYEAEVSQQNLRFSSSHTARCCFSTPTCHMHAHFFSRAGHGGTMKSAHLFNEGYTA